MSGVVAVFMRDGSVVDAADVDAVLQHQAHRGPDGLGVWCEESVGLDHASFDPTGIGGTVIEPLVNDGGRLAIVCDFRIDNRRELIASLGGGSAEGSVGGDGWAFGQGGTAPAPGPQTNLNRPSLVSVLQLAPRIA